MAFQQFYSQEWKSVASAAAAATTTTSEEPSLNDGFDCNICFEFAKEPVVTLCGHLYCWPCIYKWLHVQSASLSSDEHPQCPVCKAVISHTTMVPLYGRGQSTEEETEAKTPGSSAISIPPRPPACGTQALATSSTQTGQQLPYRNPYRGNNHHDIPPMAYASFDETATSPSLPDTGFHHHPGYGVLGEVVFARVFGNSDSLHAYPNSYQLNPSGSSRLRRQDIQADKSLSRISFFLFCCALLCLIVF
ncbi:unnamed protein product [Linum trigynum]|uniref:E3 ubiquitin-protein ligase RMA n=1 Tax=Linum trigynum TaxID=586398 RepID=A0AAV2DFU5_9ROSI